MTNERLDNIDIRLERLLASHEQALARLDRVEAISEANQRQIEANTTAIADLRQAVSSMIETVTIYHQNFEASQRNFDLIMGEIRGLRTENLRILDRLFGQQDT